MREREIPTLPVLKTGKVMAAAYERMGVRGGQAGRKRKKKM